MKFTISAVTARTARSDAAVSCFEQMNVIFHEEIAALAVLARNDTFKIASAHNHRRVFALYTFQLGPNFSANIRSSTLI